MGTVGRRRRTLELALAVVVRRVAGRPAICGDSRLSKAAARSEWGQAAARTVAVLDHHPLLLLVAARLQQPDAVIEHFGPQRHVLFDAAPVKLDGILDEK